MKITIKDYTLLSLFLVELLFIYPFKIVVSQPSVLEFPSYKQGKTICDLSGDWHFGTNEQESVIRLPKYQGKYSLMVYKKAFQLDPRTHSKNDTYFLKLNGIDGASSIFLNDKLIGGTKGYPLPVFIRLGGESLLFGEPNELSIKVDTRLSNTETLPLFPRFKGFPPRGGGIYRDLSITMKSRPNIDKISLEEITSSGPGRIRISFENSINEGQDQIQYTCQLQLHKKSPQKLIWESFSKNVSLEKDHTFYLKDIHLDSWNLMLPQLYRLRVILYNKSKIVDENWIQFGFNKITQINNKMTINQDDQNLKLIEWVEGKSIRELEPLEYRSNILEDVHTVRSLGANGIRIVNDFPPSCMVNFCDSLGIGLFVEIPQSHIPHKILEKEEYQNLAIHAIRHLVQTFKMHPSIIAWGIGNGFDLSSQAHQHFIQILVQTVRELDNRPVYLGITSASNLSSAADIHIFNFSNDNKELKKLESNDNTVGFPRLVVPLQIHQTMQAGELFQAFQLNRKLDLGKSLNSMGIAVGPLRDWKGDSPHLYWANRRNANLFMGGLLDFSSRPRPAFQVVRAHYNKTSMSGLINTEIKEKEPILFLVIALFVTMLFLFIYKNDKGLRRYLKRAYLFPHGFYMDLSENRQVSLFLSIFVGTLSFLAFILLLSSALYFFRQNWMFDYFLTWLAPSPEMKYKFIWIIWHPAVMILALLLLFYILVLLQTLILKIAIISQKRFIKTRQLFTLCLWVPVNLLLLLPLTIFYYRTFDRPVLLMSGLIFIIFILGWFIVRVFRSITVILNLSSFKTFIICSIIIILLFFVLGFYQNDKGLFAFVHYFLKQAI
jgi:hypothetical protein